MKKTYMSTFAAGLEKVIADVFVKELEGVKIIESSSGMIVYSYQGSAENLLKVRYFNNTFEIYSTYQGKQLDFNYMVRNFNFKALRDSKFKNNDQFRVRFSNKNQFVKFDKQKMSACENQISKFTKLKPNRVLPTLEFWFIIRAENIGFFCRRLTNKKTAEERTRKGELREEFASLLVAWASIKSSNVILEPCSGYGSIPREIVKKGIYGKLIVGDNDTSKVNMLRKEFSNLPNIEVTKTDVLELSLISDKSVDIIITDPPWGEYDKMKEQEISRFYNDMMDEFFRVIKTNGRVVLVTSRSSIIKSTMDKMHQYKKLDNIDFLLNGKKATIWKLIKNH